MLGFCVLMLLVALLVAVPTAMIRAKIIDRL